MSKWAFRPGLSGPESDAAGAGDGGQDWEGNGFGGGLFLASSEAEGFGFGHGVLDQRDFNVSNGRGNGVWFLCLGGNGLCHGASSADKKAAVFQELPDDDFTP